MRTTVRAFALGLCLMFGAINANAVPLQTLLDGGSLRVGSWLVKDWRWDYSDLQTLGRFVASEWSFGDVDVTGAEAGTSLSINFDWAGHYWVSGAAFLDEYYFTVQSLDPFVGIQSVTQESPIGYTLSGSLNANVGATIYAPYLDLGEHEGVTLENGEITREYLSLYGSIETDPRNTSKIFLFNRISVAAQASSEDFSLFSYASLNRTSIDVIGVRQDRPVRAPEPTTLAVFGLGLAAFVFIARRRATVLWMNS